MSKSNRVNPVAGPVYEPPRLEPAAALRGPLQRGPLEASWNIVCSTCSSGN
jgi:hypothetical protein